MPLKAKRSSISGALIHYIVAAIIEQDDKILLMDRRFQPPGYACPQGHIEKDETELDALAREILEETNMKLVRAELLHEGLFDREKCRHDVNYHYWHIYRCVVDGTPQMNNEAKSLDWYTRAELATLPLEPAWSAWFKKLGYLP